MYLYIHHEHSLALHSKGHMYTFRMTQWRLYIQILFRPSKPGGKFLWGFSTIVQETEPFLFNQNNWSFSNLRNVQLPSRFLLQLAKCGSVSTGILNRGYPKNGLFLVHFAFKQKRYPSYTFRKLPYVHMYILSSHLKTTQNFPFRTWITWNSAQPQPWAGNLSPSCGSNIQVTINPSKTTQILGVWTGQSSMFPKGMEDHKKVWYTRSLSTKCWLYPSTSEPTKLVQEPRTGKIFGFWLLNRRHLGGPPGNGF